MKVLKFMSLLTTILLCSCVKSELDVPMEKPIPDGKVRLKIQTNNSGFEQPITRVGNEDIAGDDLWAFIFERSSSTASDDNMELIEMVKISGPSSGVYTIEFEMPKSTDGKEEFKIVILANAPKYFYDINNSSDKEFVTDNLTGITDYTTLKKKLNSIKIGTTGGDGLAESAIINMDGSLLSNIPMSGYTDWIKWADYPTTDNPLKINLMRSVAKVAVKNEVTSSDFELLGVSICNAPARGYMLSPTSLTEDLLRDNTVFVDYNEPNNVTDWMYLNPTKPNDETGVIIRAKYKGTEYYYRLEMKEDYNDGNGKILTGSKNYYFRNFAYTYLIKDVNGKGYATLEDAKAGGASNIMGTIDANIKVIDLTSHDIVDNGEYFLGLSNSEFDFWVTGEVELPVSTIVYTTGVSNIKIDVTSFEGANPTIVTSNVTSGSDLKMKFPAQFQSCIVRVIYGNLVKYITIKRYATLSPAAITNSKYGTKDFVYGIVESGDEWLGLSDNDKEGFSGSKEVVINDTKNGGIFIRPQSNVAASGAENRTATAYLSRRNGIGRKKVYFVQNAVNTNDGINGENPDFVPFGGAYWRADQIGERLIRVTPKTGIDISGYLCVATAYYDESWDPQNGDGIVMDTEKSNDLSLDWTNPSATPADMNDHVNDDLYSVKNNTKFVDAFNTNGKEIYFRIGLQKPFTPSREKPARYAMVVITYTSNSGNNSYSRNQVLLVRQGHDADYLMRPTDKYGNSQSWASGPNWRPNAKKLLPYNLRDENWSIDATSQGFGETVFNKNKLTDYPSQAGYHFLFRGLTAIPNNLINGINTTNGSGGFVASSDETCPAGYRRINDGDRNSSFNFAQAGAQGSEIRQSLWLSPKTGNGISSADNGNAIKCYYADGYFDRRMIQNAAGQYDPEPSSAVMPSDVKVAYMGYLFYNPNNFASIFFPAGGRRSMSSPYPNEYKGSAGSYLTSTATNGNDFNYSLNTSWNGVYGNETYTFSFGKSKFNAKALPAISPEGYPASTVPCMMSWNTIRGGMIRCVKDE